MEEREKECEKCDVITPQTVIKLGEVKIKKQTRMRIIDCI
jgi:hypothetical protein